MHAAPPATASAEAALCQPLFRRFPGRESQIKTLCALVDPSVAPCRNIVVHGTEASGKSAVTGAVLAGLSAENEVDEDDDAERRDIDAPQNEEVDGRARARRLAYAIIDSNKCVTARHLFERTVGQVADAVNRRHGARSSSSSSSSVGTGKARHCESLSQLTVELAKLLTPPVSPADAHFVLVLDAIDRQRDMPPTLLPGLARLSEVIPRLTVVFVVTFPTPSMLRTSFVPHVHFANYGRTEFVEILCRTPPPTLANATADETAELWARLATAVHDSLTRTAGRTLPAFRAACTALWPKFTAPVRAGTHGPREFSKLLIAARVHFQDEALLDPSFVEEGVVGSASSSDARHLAALLPATARLLLLCAYLASHNAARHDTTLFSTYHHGRKRRRGGLAVGGAGAGGGAGARSKHRKIARKLLGAHSFPLERLLAIFVAVRSEWTRAPPVTATGRNSAAAVVDADCQAALATLASLRLVVRVAGPASDPIDHAGKWRVNVGWEVVRSLGRSLGIEMEEWLID